MDGDIINCIETTGEANLVANEKKNLFGFGHSETQESTVPLVGMEIP